MSMGKENYARLYGSFAFDKKILAVGNAAAGAFVRLLAWSAENKTDGALDIGIVSNICTPAQQRQLITVGLLDGEYMGPLTIRNYLNRNPDAAYLESISAKRAAAGSKGGLAKATAIALANDLAKPLYLSLNEETEKTEPLVSIKHTSEQRYAHAYAEGQVSAAPGTTYPDPFDQTQLGELNRFTLQQGWGKGLRGEALLEAIRAVSRAYRKAMANDAFHSNAGYPPKLCIRWAAGSGWKPPRRPADTSLGQSGQNGTLSVAAQSGGHLGPAMTKEEYAAEMQKLAASLDGVKT